MTTIDTNTSIDPRTARQLDLLRRMSELSPAPCVFGGYAEDALLAGAVTRPHQDVDWLLPRGELDLRLDQARSLGFAESRPGARLPRASPSTSMPRTGTSASTWGSATTWAAGTSSGCTGSPSSSMARRRPPATRSHFRLTPTLTRPLASTESRSAWPHRSRSTRSASASPHKDRSGSYPSATGHRPDGSASCSSRAAWRRILRLGSSDCSSRNERDLDLTRAASLISEPGWRSGYPTSRTTSTSR
jgi:hypothetical protein